MIKIKGITDRQLLIIQQILSNYSEIEFYLYGSRVNGNFSHNSDLDILAKGKSKLSFDLLEELKYKFDISDLPFIVHVSDFYRLDKNFVNLIKNSLRKL